MIWVAQCYHCKQPYELSNSVKCNNCNHQVHKGCANNFEYPFEDRSTISLRRKMGGKILSKQEEEQAILFRIKKCGYDDNQLFKEKFLEEVDNGSGRK